MAPSNDGPRPPLLHPLLASDPRTLLRAIARGGPVPPRFRSRLAIAVAGSVLRLPFTVLERLKVSLDRRRRPPMPAPVFIVGHWRSGTTFLQEVLGRSPRLGFVSTLATGMPWEFLTLARWLRPLLARAMPEDRYIDRIPVEPDSPQEDEGALALMQSLSYYHGLYFPRRFTERFREGVFLEGCRPREAARREARLRTFLEKVWLEQQPRGARRLLVKNPIYTAQIPRLRRMWPGARFVHIHRDPYRVFPSMRNFYHSLLPEMALQPYDHLDIEEIVLSAYPPLLDAYLEARDDIPPGHLCEVRFETFEADPLGEARRIHEELGLEGFAQARPHVEAYLESVADYRKNDYRMSGPDVEKVRERWGRFVDLWGYEPPG